MNAALTIEGARRLLSKRFRDAGIESPELDARVLVGHVTGLEHVELVAERSRPLTAAQSVAIETAASRRLSREPVARIVGYKEFWGLALAVTPATLVPRPETETVVEAALAAVDTRGSRTDPWRIADIGTGSGALLLALLTELRQATGVATDNSIAALIAARDNAQRLGLATRTQFVCCDLGAALAGGFDIVVSNPPYIASVEIDGLEPEVLADPRPALDGGPDGLASYRGLVADAARLLAPHGRLFVELGHRQESAVKALMHQAGLTDIVPRTDLEGTVRVLSGSVATKQP